MLSDKHESVKISSLSLPFSFLIQATKLDNMCHVYTALTHNTARAVNTSPPPSMSTVNMHQYKIVVVRRKNAARNTSWLTEMCIRASVRANNLYGIVRHTGICGPTVHITPRTHAYSRNSGR